MEPSSGEKIKWYYRPWFVILMLIFVLGPFGLPLVYKSPAFSTTWKIILTVLMMVYLWLLIVSTYGLVIFMLGFLERLTGAVEGAG